MADPFDPSDFDALPSSDPQADYRTLLDAMRKAGAEGVAEQTATLARQIAQEARQRADWTKQVGIDGSRPPAGRRSAPAGQHGHLA